MKVGLGRLGLSPREFWAATPREISAAATGLLGDVAGHGMRRAELAALAARFPDDGEGHA
jgi:uncharacterized phage protein (TIGR02216 family)